MNTFAHLALQEFRQRKASIDRAVAEGRFDREAGNENLNLWASVLLACGATPAQLGALGEEWQRTRKLSGEEARQLFLRAGPSREAYLAELARARDVAQAKHRDHPGDYRLEQRYHALKTLAAFLGATAAKPVRKAA